MSPLQRYVTRVVNSWCGISYRKPTVNFSSNTVVSVEKSHVVNIQRQIRTRYLTEILPTKIFYFFLYGVIIYIYSNFVFRSFRRGLLNGFE